MSSHHENLRGIMSMAFAVFVFAMMDAMMKHLSPRYPPIELSALRCFSSLVVLLIPLVWTRNLARLRTEQPLLLILRAFLGIGMLGFFVYAVRSLSLAETYTMFLCAPLCIAALSGPLLREHVPARRWIAIGIGLAGVTIILQPQGTGLRSFAGLAAALATLCYVFGAILVRYLGRSNTNESLVFWFLLMVGTLAGTVSIIVGWHGIEPRDWIWLAGIGLTGALGQYWFTDAFRRAPPAMVAPFEYTSILWAFVIDWVFWAATPNAALVTGAAVVVSSGLYVIWDERRRARLITDSASVLP
jgi:drug/metabolite transporter (DMT)-like permease